MAPPVAAERASASRSPTTTSWDRIRGGHHSIARGKGWMDRRGGSNVGGAIGLRGKDRRWRRRARHFDAHGLRAYALADFGRSPFATFSTGFATNGWFIADKVTVVAAVGAWLEGATTAPQTAVTANVAARTGRAASTAPERSRNEVRCKGAEFGRIP